MSDTGFAAGVEPFADLFKLDAVGDNRFRNRYHESNLNGRGHAFGGQLLAQALVAAARTAGDRIPTAMQLLFLRGADTRRPIDFQVIPFRDGRRFANRHVQGLQGEDIVVNAHLSFQAEQTPGWTHDLPPVHAPSPDTLLSMTQLNQLHRERLAAMNYHLYERPCLELKLIDAEHHLFNRIESGRVRWWIRLKQSLPADPLMHSAAIAYLSDWWTSSTVVAPHLPIAGARDRVYLASMNHSLWLHRPAAADDWLLFVTESPHSSGGRGLSVGRIYDRNGRIIASLAQECSIGERAADKPADSPLTAAARISTPLDHSLEEKQ